MFHMGVSAPLPSPQQPIQAPKATPKRTPKPKTNDLDSESYEQRGQKRKLYFLHSFCPFFAFLFPSSPDPLSNYRPLIHFFQFYLIFHREEDIQPAESAPKESPLPPPLTEGAPRPAYQKTQDKAPFLPLAPYFLFQNLIPIFPPSFPSLCFRFCVLFSPL